MPRDPTEQLRDALDEVVAFLADRKPPALVVDSVETLAATKPELLAAEIRTWADEQHRIRRGAVPVHHLLLHALAKLQVFDDLEMLRGDRFRRYLEQVTVLLHDSAPPEEREAFLAGLVDLRGAGGSSLATLRPARAPGGAPGAAPPATSAPRPGPAASGAGAPQAGADPPAAGGGGVDSWSTTGVFEVLTHSVPDWAVTDAGQVTTPQGAPLHALHRIVTSEADRKQAADRWEQMVRSAASHFNEGALARAVTLLELAARLAKDGDVDAESAERVREVAHAWLSIDRLRDDAGDLARRPLLRKLMDFFPALSAGRLIENLAAEPDRHNRRFLLMLLEATGKAGREVVLARLETALMAPPHQREAWFLQRNLLYLLNRLPRPADADVAWELRVAGVLTNSRLPVPLVREAVTFVGSLPHPGVAPLLIDRMREVEKALVDGDAEAHPVPQLWRLANALASALARAGTTEARMALVEHALSFHPRLGDTAARLADLAGADLSGQPEVVAALLDSLRQLAPVRMLGVMAGRNDDALVAIVRSLAATRTPEVRQALEDVARRYPDREFGKAAAEATHREIELAPAPNVRPAPRRGRVAFDSSETSLTGDLGVFGLPHLVQTLQQSRGSGQLMLRAENGLVFAVFRFVDGRLAECVAGGLRGEEAFYQALQRPTAGTFDFQREAPAGGSSIAALEVTPLLMEGIRRYDVLQRDRALVADDAYVKGTGRRPTTPEGEEDGELVRLLWTRVRDGATVTECEMAARRDTYRVRRLLAHWVAEGSAELADGRVARGEWGGADEG